MYTAAAAAAYSAANRIATSAERTADPSLRTSVQDLERMVERQALLIQTLLMLMLEKKVVHEDEFREWLAYVDELDGVRDGRVREEKAPVSCPKCRRNNPRTAAKCQYCGEEFTPEFLFRRPPQAG